MKPLRENPEVLTRGEQLLSSLFEALPKTEGDPFATRRLRVRLEQRAKRRSRGAKIAIIVGCLGLATGAAAMVGRGLLSSPSPVIVSGTGAPTAHLSERVPISVSAPEVEASVSVAPVIAAPPLVESAVSATPSRERVVLATGEDPTLVAAAIQALRKEHNPAQARQLLHRYLKANPRGALAEEALALSIEAASAMKDKQALGLARTYLSIYPSGRHRQLAERVLANSVEK